MSFNLDSVIISGKETYPIIEGGKGIGVSNGVSAGSFAKSFAVGTFSGVNAEIYDDNGKQIPIIYHGKTRRERHEELIAQGILGGISQAKRAYDISSGSGPIHMNILWEMGGAQRILEGILEGAKGLIHGITCGAGMPYKLSEIAEKFNLFYYPIVSSMRAFRALWKRAYEKHSKFLGAVVYEDPWKAGGHNGLSNGEDPNIFEDPYPRVAQLRKFMNDIGLKNLPIIMAGGVWHLKDWAHWLKNPEIGPVAFQFGTRPIVTVESPVPLSWKQKLLKLQEGDVFLNKFSPTGFYSSAVNNNFIKELRDRNGRQLPFSNELSEEFSEIFEYGPRNRKIFLKKEDAIKASDWRSQGLNEILKTPDSTIIFVTKEYADQIMSDQINCMGCLSHCKFSNWKDHDNYSTDKKADPRSFCIQKTLKNIIQFGDVENELMFSGHNAFKFATDPFYSNGFIPTIKQLVDRIMTGN